MVSSTYITRYPVTCILRFCRRHVQPVRVTCLHVSLEFDEGLKSSACQTTEGAHEILDLDNGQIDRMHRLPVYVFHHQRTDGRHLADRQNTKANTHLLVHLWSAFTMVIGDLLVCLWSSFTAVIGDILVCLWSTFTAVNGDLLVHLVSIVTATNTALLVRLWSAFTAYPKLANQSVFGL